MGWAVADSNRRPPACKAEPRGAPRRPPSPQPRGIRVLALIRPGVGTGWEPPSVGFYALQEDVETLPREAEGLGQFAHRHASVVSYGMASASVLILLAPI